MGGVGRGEGRRRTAPRTAGVPRRRARRRQRLPTARPAATRGMGREGEARRWEDNEAAGSAEPSETVPLAAPSEPCPPESELCQPPPASAQTPAPDSSPPPSMLSRAASFGLRHYLPLGLVTAIIFSAFVPQPGKALASPGFVGQICIGAIFFISGLGLKTADIRHAVSEWRGMLLGVVFILGITPLAALVVLELPLEPREFMLGLAVFACMPTTLSSGVLLTRQAKGNFALALLLTVTTNLLGVITVPFMLSALLGSTAGMVSIDPLPLLYKLALSILLPLAVGKGVRELAPAVQKRVDGPYKRRLSLLSSTFLILVPLMRVSVANEQLRAVTVSQLLAILAAGVGLHVGYMAVVAPAVALVPIPTPERKAVFLLSTEKTLPVAITVIAFIADELTSVDAEGNTVDASGLMAIPCIVAHLTQVVMDSFLAERWAAATDREEAKRKAEELEAKRAAGDSDDVTLELADAAAAAPPSA